MSESFKKCVESALNDVRGRLALHGGGIELVDADAETGIVSVRFLGACVDCPLAAFTLEGIVEDRLTSVQGFSDVISIGPEDAAASDPPAEPTSSETEGLGTESTTQHT
jgi:Fe-S cluster biogenesis protein NfuA